LYQTLETCKLKKQLLGLELRVYKMMGKREKKKKKKRRGSIHGTIAINR
jgi:hypothetical protein